MRILLSSLQKQTPHFLEALHSFSGVDRGKIINSEQNSIDNLLKYEIYQKF